MAIKILLADDSLTIQKVVELTFSDAETRLMAVGSGDRAVQALDDFQPDLVLADVVMPGLSGYDVCEAVKQRPGGAFVPVVLLTGTFEPFDRARAERVGSDAIVTKPFDSHALQGLVRDLVGKAHAAREEAEAQAAAAPAPAPEPPPTMVLSAEELAETFPPPAPLAVDTASPQVLSLLDLADSAPPPFVEAATAAPEGESLYSTMAMKTLPEGGLEEPLAEPPPPPAFYESEEAAAAEPPPPPPAFYEPEPAFATEPPPPPAFYEPEPAFVPAPPPPPPAFYEPEPAFVPAPPPPPPAFYEPEPAFATEPPPPPPAFYEPEPAFEPEPAVAPPPPPVPFSESEAGPDTAPLPRTEAAFEASPDLQTGPVPVEIEVELEDEPYGSEPASAPVVEEPAEPFPEMDEPPPVAAEAAPWDEEPVAEIPPPPELSAIPSDADGAEPITRDLDADLAAFEASGMVRRRPEIWERHAALIGEEVPEDIDVHTPMPEEAPEPGAGSESAELEEIAAAARLEDLSKLIPGSPTPAPEAAPPRVEAPAVLGALSDGDVDRIARRVVELLADRVVRDIAWEVVPEYAERLVRERIAEVERAG